MRLSCSVSADSVVFCATDDSSDSEGSVESNQSCRNEKTLPERLEILTNQGLLPAVKVFLDWLRANTDIIVMCAQSSQSLWNRLSVLLNLLPDSRKILEAGKQSSDGTLSSTAGTDTLYRFHTGTREQC
ncbi:SMG5 protein, partial [Polyodon spathula]|nr:SMG5 protein [Polyodon spathula]